MPKKSKRRSKKKARQKLIPVITINLTGDQIDQARESIGKHGFAAFQIVEIDSTPDVLTTKTVHR